MTDPTRPLASTIKNVPIASINHLVETIEYVRLNGLIGDTPETAEIGLETENALIDDLARDDLNTPHVRMWTNPRSLVATSRHASRESFSEAASASDQRGWPVVVRKTGGTVVPHGPGILNVSVVHTTASASIDAGYAPLIELISSALEQLNIQHDWGNKPNSFCDGKFNLLVNQRKAAGTAARLKNTDRKVWLAHASILIRCELDEAVDALVQFEKDLGYVPDYLVRAHTNLFV